MLNVAPVYSEYAEKACSSIAEIGAMVLASTALFQSLEMADEWHAKATEDNKVKIANDLAR
eukprot:10370921-Karenia_brevis.AAC.1